LALHNVAVVAVEGYQVGPRDFEVAEKYKTEAI
jgi:hypothetical protein